MLLCKPLPCRHALRLALCDTDAQQLPRRCIFRHEHSLRGVARHVYNKGRPRLRRRGNANLRRHSGAFNGLCNAALIAVGWRDGEAGAYIVGLMFFQELMNNSVNAQLRRTCRPAGGVPGEVTDSDHSTCQCHRGEENVLAAARNGMVPGMKHPRLHIHYHLRFSSGPSDGEPAAIAQEPGARPKYVSKSSWLNAESGQEVEKLRTSLSRVDDPEFGWAHDPGWCGWGAGHSRDGAFGAFQLAQLIGSHHVPLLPC